jgi:hypothetical protein
MPVHSLEPAASSEALFIKRSSHPSNLARYVAWRYRDEENSALVGGYTGLDANLSYAWGHVQVAPRAPTSRTSAR